MAASESRTLANLLATRDDPTKVALMGSFVVGGLEAHSFDELRTIFDEG